MAYERLMRRHAKGAGPDVTIDDEVEEAGIEDADQPWNRWAPKRPGRT